LAEAAGNPDIVSRVKQIIKNVLSKNFVSKAPLVVVACLDRRISDTYGSRGVDLYAIQDVAASVMNMMLAAHELGLGSVWVGAFDEESVAKILNLPEYLRPVVLVPIGYPAVPPAASSRKLKEDIIAFVR